MDQPPESPKKGRGGPSDSANHKQDDESPPTPPLPGGPSLGSPFKGKNMENQPQSQYESLGLGRGANSAFDDPKTPDRNTQRSKNSADSPQWSTPASPRETGFGRASPTDSVDTTESNTELDFDSPARAFPGKILYTNGTTQNPSQPGDPSLNTGRDTSNPGPNDDPTSVFTIAELSSLRNRRWQNAQGKGRHFHIPSNLRRESNIPGLVDGYRRFSQPGLHARHWDIESPVMPHTAVPANYYGPFDIIHENRHTDIPEMWAGERNLAKKRTKLDNDALDLQQRWDEDLNRIRNTRFVQLPNGVLVPLPLVELIGNLESVARLADQKPLKLSRLQGESLRIRSYDDFEQILRNLDAAEVLGSSLLPENIELPDPPALPYTFNPISDQETVKKLLGSTFDFIRLNWDVIDEEEIRKIRWSVNGEFAFPKFEFVGNWARKAAAVPGLPASMLKWVLNLLRFLFDEASKCGLMAVDQARDLVKSISERLQSIRVPVDYVGQACSQIWNKLNRRKREVTETTRDFANNVYIPRPKPSRTHLYMMLIFSTSMLIAWFWKDILAILRSVPLPGREESEILTVSLVNGKEKVLNWAARLRSLMLSWSPLLVNCLEILWNMLGDFSVQYLWLPVLALILVCSCTLRQWTKSSIAFISAAPALTTAGLMEGLPAQIDNVTDWLKKVVNALDLSVKVQAIRRSLNWLLPFIGGLFVLWRWGSLEALTDHITTIVKKVLNILVAGCEFITLCVQEIPYDAVRNVLLNCCLWTLSSVYQLKAIIAPYIGATTVAAFLVTIAIMLDQIFGEGYFWKWLVKLYIKLEAHLLRLPSLISREVQRTWTAISNFFNFVVLVSTYSIEFFWHIILESTQDFMNGAVKLNHEIRTRVSSTYHFTVDFISDVIAFCLITLGDWTEHLTLGPLLHETFELDWPFYFRSVCGWIFRTLSVAAGVWLALFICGMCISCVGDACFDRAEMSLNRPHGIHGLWWSLQESLAQGMRQQHEALGRIGNAVARFLKDQERLGDVRDMRDALLMEKLEKVTHFIDEEKSRRATWCLGRLFGFGS